MAKVAVEEGVRRVLLGQRVRDPISGFCGTATCRSEYLHGATRVCVEASGLEGGKPVEQWFDERRLVPIEK